ncbi:MAG TPA: hypothetical protein VN461_20940 [Vicinamibacteria bacterium]|jgi:hypothetical protein|nr:hypothetical protein [Vicinamibacteria bacterium]
MTLEESPRGSPLGLGSAALKRSAAQVRDGVWDAVRRLSPKGRFALSLGLLAAILLAVSVFLSLPSATLKLVCRHDFRTAELTVWIDGSVVHTDTMTGAVKKLWGVLEKTEGTYSRTLPVSSGKHLVQVRIRGTGYDRTRSIQANFARGTESTLGIDSGRELLLAWRTPVAGTEPSGGTSLFRYAGSVLMTIFGSVISASIGVLVQNFLRSRKAGVGQAEAPSQSPKIAP